MTSENSGHLERSLVYRLLARLWAEEPGELLAQLASEPLLSAWQQLGGVLPDHTSDEVRASLDEDYCRLFVGPRNHLPPIQSVWTSGELDTGVTASLREFDTVVGFDEPWDFAIIPDHLGNEMWAMGQILRKSAGLTPDEMEIAEDLAGQFFMGHLSWTDQFLKAVVNCECDRFYGTVAAITQRFLKDEAARFQSSVTTK